MAGWLRELVPGLRVTVGHGQMDEQELSRRMHAFTAGDYDLLLASTIIENGIHIPRVNTMLVHNAQRFGLAQLYQLRGRVGRSNTLAYCYLLVPSDRVLPIDARKRLDALRDFSELGANGVLPAVAGCLRDHPRDVGVHLADVRDGEMLKVAWGEFRPLRRGDHSR